MNEHQLQPKFQFEKNMDPNFHDWFLERFSSIDFGSSSISISSFFIENANDFNIFISTKAEESKDDVNTAIELSNHINWLINESIDKFSIKPLVVTSEELSFINQLILPENNKKKVFILLNHLPFNETFKEVIDNILTIGFNQDARTAFPDSVNAFMLSSSINAISNFLTENLSEVNASSQLNKLQEKLTLLRLKINNHEFVNTDEIVDLCRDALNLLFH